MTFKINHAKVSTGTDNPAYDINPSNWNADLVTSMATSKLLGRSTAGVGTVEEITPGTGLTLSAGTLSAFDGTWTSLSGKPTFATVATSGAYSDLTGKPGNFSSSVAGFTPASGGGTSNFLRADGTWAAPAGGSASLFTPSTSGIVPASGGGTSNFLRADGTWTSTGSASVASGFSVGVNNPTIGGDPGNRRAVDITVDTDHSAGNPGFTNECALTVSLSAHWGQNSYTSDGNKTIAKTSFVPVNASLTSQAAGQKFVTVNYLTAYGMGDNFLYNASLNFAGANVAGDEGTGLNSVSYIQQQGGLALYSIDSKPTQSTYSTTITQEIIGSKDPQTVTVASTSGANVGDWVVIGQEPATGYENLDCAQITAVGSGTITAIFYNHFPVGTTITPALVLNLNGGFALGQGRWLVNLSATGYSTGSISSIAYDVVNGSGVSWSNTMAGGIANNVGAISFDADTYTGNPFNGTGANGPLRSWYTIRSVQSSTALQIHSFSCAANTDYRGKAPAGGGGYIIRPAARILRIVGVAQVICETSNPASWSAGHNLELAIAPFPDITGSQWVVAAYTPGGTYRGFYNVSNRGARKFDYGYTVGANMKVGSNADTVGWEAGFQTEDSIVNYGTLISRPLLAAHRMNVDFAAPADTQGKIQWYGYNTFLGPDYANYGMKWQTIATSVSGDGLLSFKSSSILGTIASRMDWDAALKLTNSGGTSNSYRAPLYLGSYALWVDSSGNLRKKSGVPTADADGVALGAGGGYTGDIGTLATMGGTTNAYPALKRNGTAVEVRLADDSALTRLDVGSLYVSGVAVTGGSGGYTGDIGTFATMGGTTSSFPALKRSTTGIQVRLADDSALAPLTVGSLTVGTTAITGAWADITGKPSFATVATSGAYTDLTGRPSLATVATTGAYSDLTGKPGNFTSTVAGLTPASGGGTSNFLRADGTWSAPVGYTGDIGTFASMGGTTSSFPALKRSTTGIQVRLADDSGLTRLDVGSLFVNGTSLAAVATSGAYSDLTGTPSLATVATSGAYADLTGKPGNFTSTVAGLTPASGGGTTNYLRADGTWAAPPGGGGFSGDIGTFATMGGTTSSFPALKRSTTSIQVRLADDSALTRLDVGSLFVNGTSLATVATTGAYADLSGKPGNVTSSTAGLAPASGGGTTNFLRADGTWAAPAGGGGSSYTNLLQNGSNALDLRNGTNPQNIQIFNTYTSGTNYEGVSIGWDGSNQFVIGSIWASPGGAHGFYYRAANHNFQTATGFDGTINALQHLMPNVGGFEGGGANGVVKLANVNGDDFARLVLGGTTSSYPAIKRSGTGVIIRLADDSANAPLTASTLVLTALPTSDPAVAGKLWNSAGTVKISAG